MLLNLIMLPEKVTLKSLKTYLLLNPIMLAQLVTLSRIILLTKTLKMKKCTYIDRPLFWINCSHYRLSWGKWQASYSSHLVEYTLKFLNGELHHFLICLMWTAFSKIPRGKFLVLGDMQTVAAKIELFTHLIRTDSAFALWISWIITCIAWNWAII